MQDQRSSSELIQAAAKKFNEIYLGLLLASEDLEQFCYLVEEFCFYGQPLIGSTMLACIIADLSIRFFGEESEEVTSQIQAKILAGFERHKNLVRAASDIN